MQDADVRALLTMLGSNPDRMEFRERTRNGTPIAQVNAECPLAPWTHDRGTDRSRGFDVTITKATESRMHCFACGVGGTLVNLLWAYEASSKKRVPEAWDLVRLRDVLSPFADPVVLGEYADPPARLTRQIDEIPTYPEEWLDAFDAKPPRYVMSRGISLPVAHELGVRYDPRWNRAVFPIRDAEGRLVGAVGRLCGPGDPRWWNYWHFPRGLLLAYEYALKPEGSIAVVEGLFDLAWLRQQGIRNGVAILGSGSATEQQIARLARLRRPIYLLLDNDVPGRSSATRIASRLSGKCFVKIPEYPEGAFEPTDLSRESLIKMLVAPPSFSY